MLITFLDRRQLMAKLGDCPALALAELGVWRGEFSRFCMETLCLRSLTLVDAWSEGSYSPAGGNAPQASREVGGFLSEPMTSPSDGSAHD